MLSNHLILCHPLLLLPSIFPSIRVFSSELALCIRWPGYWNFSFSISPSVNIQGWFPLGLTGLISWLLIQRLFRFGCFWVSGCQIDAFKFNSNFVNLQLRNLQCLPPPFRVNTWSLSLWAAPWGAWNHVLFLPTVSMHSHGCPFDCGSLSDICSSKLSPPWELRLCLFFSLCVLGTGLIAHSEYLLNRTALTRRMLIWMTHRAVQSLEAG